jgi:glycosyltransferase involved in cell wall biosynthesis
MIRICKTKNTNVTIFTTEEIFSRLKINLDDSSKYDFILKKEGESISRFLKRVEKICNEKIDLLFINTIQTIVLDLSRYIGFKPKSKMILTIHITNHWLKAKFAFNIKNILRSIDANICLFLIRTIILPKFNAINVIYPPTREYILKNTNYKKEVFTLPFNFYDENKKIIRDSKDDKIRVVISGKIEEFRRNYETALDVFEKLSERFSGKLILYLLGQPIGKYGDRIIERCKKLKKKGYNISFPTGFVSEEKYNQTLTESDILFSPLKIRKVIETGIEETYGKSEGSAIPFEAIQNSKPLILPKAFQIIKELKSSTVQYDSPKDLENKLAGLIEHREKLEKLKKEAEKNSKYFSLESIQKYFTSELLNRLDDL